MVTRVSGRTKRAEPDQTAVRVAALRYGRAGLPAVTRMRSVGSPAIGETTRMRDAHRKGSRRLMLPRVGLEADPVPVSRLKQMLRPARFEPARAR